MFNQFTVTILPERTGLAGYTLQTCVLGYACYMRDRYLLNICKAALKEEQRERYKEIVLAYPIKDELMTLDKIQAHDGYRIFMALVELWLKKEVGKAMTAIIEANGCRSMIVDINDAITFIDIIHKAIRLNLPVIIPFAVGEGGRPSVTAKSDDAHWATIIGHAVIE
jgi:hypothetical protein